MTLWAALTAPAIRTTAVAITPVTLLTQRAFGPRIFDNLGRVKIVTMPTGDANPGSTTTVQIDYAGTVTTVTDQAGKQRRQITDGLGRVVRLHEPDANGSLGPVGAPAQETTYEYDALDNLIHISQVAQPRYFKYDSLSRLTHERQVEQDSPFTTPDSVAGNNQWSRKLIYNSNGLVTDAYDARQINTHIGYDGLNRVLQITYSNGTPAVNYTYDQARTGFFNQGRLTTITTAAVGQTPSTTQEFDYERLSRVAAQRQKIGAASYALTYDYNYAGLLLSERYPSGRRANYGYDEGGRLATVTDSAGVPYANGFTYAPHGGLSSETLGNAAVHSLSYNSRLQASQVKLKQNATGAELQRFDYSYGQTTQSTGAVDVTKNNGQIGRVDSFISGAKQWDQRFTCDSLARLSQAAEYSGDNAQLTWQAHYDYDRYGNRYQYQQNVNLGFTTVLTSDVDTNRNRFISTGTTPTTYDAAGNMLTDTKFRALSYVYDANNRQTSASGTGVSQTAVYDAIGQRVQTSAGGAARQMVYDAFGQIVAEYASGSLRRENVYRGSQLLASQEFNMSAPTAKNVVWTNVSSTITVTGNSIQKTSGTNLWDSGAVSSQMITAGDGYMEFTPGETQTGRMCGLGNTDSSWYYADIEYAFFAGPSAGLEIWESGIQRGSFGTYAVSDRLRVAVEGGVVKYYRNGTLVYTSTVAPTYPLQVDTSLNTVNAGVYNVVITSDLQNVTWTNVSPTIQVTGNSIQKVSGTSSWYDAGAASSQMITAGDGYVEFTPGDTTKWRMCGLGNTDSSWYYADIDYAFFAGPSAGLEIWESGIQRGSFGTYAASDRLRVAVEGGVVKYYRNATLLYTSTVAPKYPLQVDTSLNTVNAGVYNVVISGTRVTASPINYVLQDVQGSTRAVMSGTSIIARHDFLPFGEELAAGVGMRTWGQGFGVEDKIRQRYAQTERDDGTGLDHTWWRKYENRSGRWTSPDPYNGSMRIADPQSFNRYAYVQNDPLNFVDPSGLVRVWCIAYPIGDGETATHCYVFPDPLFPREPPPRGGGRGGKPKKPTQQQPQPCDPYFFGENESRNIGGRTFTGTDLNIAARVVYAESSSGFGNVNNGPVGSQVFDERNAIASVLYNLLSPNLSTFNAVANGGRFQSVTGTDRQTQKFRGSSTDNGAYQNLRERTADGRGGDCNDLRSSVDAIRRMVNNNGPSYNFDRFRGGRTPVGNSTVIGGSRFGYGGITDTGLGPW
jgi:RHS repeat-associated protein